MAPSFEEIGTFRKICRQNLYSGVAEFFSASKASLMVVTFLLIGFKETT